MFDYSFWLLRRIKLLQMEKIHHPKYEHTYDLEMKRIAKRDSDHNSITKKRLYDSEQHLPTKAKKKLTQTTLQQVDKTTL